MSTGNSDLCTRAGKGPWLSYSFGTSVGPIQRSFQKQITEVPCSLNRTAPQTSKGNPTLTLVYSLTFVVFIQPFAIEVMRGHVTLLLITVK